MGGTKSLAGGGGAPRQQWKATKPLDDSGRAQRWPVGRTVYAAEPGHWRVKNTELYVWPRHWHTGDTGHGRQAVCAAETP